MDEPWTDADVTDEEPDEEQLNKISGHRMSAGGTCLIITVAIFVVVVIVLVIVSDLS